MPDKRGKMLGDTKKRGRCVCMGHGSDCAITKDIQRNVVTRSTEKGEVKKSILKEIINND